MNRGAFFEAAGKLLDRIENLYFTTETTLCDIEDDLCRKQDPRLNIQTSVSADLAMIALRIEYVMRIFDVLCEAAGQEPRYELALQVLDVPSLVQRQLRQL
jgi:hypothetical protein